MRDAAKLSLLVTVVAAAVVGVLAWSDVFSSSSALAAAIQLAAVWCVPQVVILGGSAAAMARRTGNARPTDPADPLPGTAELLLIAGMIVLGFAGAISLYGATAGGSWPRFVGALGLVANSALCLICLGRVAGDPPGQHHGDR